MSEIIVQWTRPLPKSNNVFPKPTLILAQSECNDMFFEFGLLPANDTTIANRTASEKALFGSSVINDPELKSRNILGADQCQQRSDQCGRCGCTLRVLDEECSQVPWDDSIRARFSPYDELYKHDKDHGLPYTCYNWSDEKP